MKVLEIQFLKTVIVIEVTWQISLAIKLTRSRIMQDIDMFRKHVTKNVIFVIR